MAPGSSIGAAEPIPKTEKNISALKAEFTSTAARKHHDSTLASAMVDKTVDVPQYKRTGAILSLTADEAARAGIAERIAPTLQDALASVDLGEYPTHTVSYSFGEELARFATSPEVSGLLLSIGMLGLLIEMQTLHGIAGLIGVSALGLFFGTARLRRGSATRSSSCSPSSASSASCSSCTCSRVMGSPASWGRSS